MRRVGVLVVAAGMLAVLPGCGLLSGSGAEVVQGATVVECRQLGGGWVYERWEDGGFHVGLGRSPESGVAHGGSPPAGMAVEESIAARIAKGWTEDRLEVLGMPRDYDRAVEMNLFEGPREEFDARWQSVEDLLAQMPPCG